MEPLKSSDWVTVSGPAGEFVEQISSVNTDTYTLRGTAICFKSQATKWAPKPGEWCWRKHDGNYILFQYLDTKRATWDLQPFTGELP